MSKRHSPETDTLGNGEKSGDLGTIFEKVLEFQVDDAKDRILLPQPGVAYDKSHKSRLPITYELLRPGLRAAQPQKSEARGKITQ